MVRARDSVAASPQNETVHPDLVASPANRSNQPTVVTRIHFSPQIVRIYVYPVRHRLHVQPPNLLDDRWSAPASRQRASLSTLSSDVRNTTGNSGFLARICRIASIPAA